MAEITREQFFAFAEKNPDALRELTQKTVSMRINALRGIPNVPAEFVLEQAVKGNDVTQAKAELADALLAHASAKTVAEASQALAPDAAPKGKK